MLRMICDGLPFMEYMVLRQETDGSVCIDFGLGYGLGSAISKSFNVISAYSCICQQLYD